MTKHKMTDRWVSAFRPSGARAEVGDLLTPGLYLRASASGVKSWSAVIRVGERVQRIAIGRYPVVPLAAARAETLRLLRLAAQGADLRAEAAAVKRAAAVLAEDAVTVGQVIEAYIEHVTRTARSWKNIAAMLRRRELMSFHPRPVASVTKREIVATIDAIAAGGSPHGASNVLRYLQTAYRYGVERDLIQFNPIEKVRAPAPIVSRDRVLSDDELRRVWHAAGTLQPHWAAMIRMMILTGQRRTEVGRARWEEISADGVWTIPRERTKKDRAQVVFLAPAVMELLSALPCPASGTGFVFSGDGGATASSYFSGAKIAIDKSACLNQPWRFHDLRRLMRTGCSRLGVAEPVAMRIMNHARSGISAVYDRYSYDTQAAEAWRLWADHVRRTIAHDAA